MEITLVKTPNGVRGWTEDDQRNWKKFSTWLKKLQAGEFAHFTWTRPRNYKFLQKFMVMVKVGFDAWEPRRKSWKGLPVQKNFDRFRKDATIAAGFYEIVATSAGGVRHEAKSLSFANMEEEEFERVYTAVADVLLQNVLKRYKRADLDRVVEQLLTFT